MSPVQVEGQLSADELVRDLKEGVAHSFATAIPPGPVALVDFPDHSNVGDSAIWLGEMAWLEDAGRAPVYHAALDNYSHADLRAVAPEGPVLIHGGGNFGTTWPRHEELRLSLLREFPGRPIVQLPQSIHYGDEAQIGIMARAIAAHGAFTLLVRDARSLALARQYFECDVRLCPDAALYLGRQQRQAPRADIFALLRTDHEGTLGAADIPSGVLAADWLEEGAGERKLMRLRLRLDAMLARSEQDRRLRRYRMLAQWRLRRGLALLSQGRVIVTDRLHAHILSLMLDIPQVVLDNSYGKVGSFAAQWTARYRHFHQAAQLDEAFALAGRIVRES